MKTHLDIVSRSLLAILCLVLSRPACADIACDTSWKGNPLTGYWDVNGNWTNSAPDKTKNACITVNKSDVTVRDLGPNVKVKNLKVGKGALLALGNEVILELFGSTLQNDGQINIAQTSTDLSKLRSDSDLTLSGTGTVYLRSDRAGFDVGGVLTNNSTISGTGYVSARGMTNNGLITAPNKNGTLRVYGSIGASGPTATNAGTMSAQNGGTLSVMMDGPFNNTGKFYSYADSTVNVSNIGGTVNRTFSNAGTVTVFQKGTMNFSGNVTVDNTKTWTVERTGKLTGKNLFKNAGSVDVQVGGSFDPSTYIQTDGITTVDGTFTVPDTEIQGGIFTGAGSVIGNVSMEGTLRPGDNGPGVISITGNYAQTSMGILDEQLGGTTPGHFDQTVISGAASLTGTLNVSLVPGFVPHLGESWEIMQFNIESGQFTTLNGFDLGDGLFLQIFYQPTDVLLKVETSLPTPEPASLLLLGSGLLGWFGRQRSRMG